MSEPYWEPLAATPSTAMPSPVGQDGKWLKAAGGAAVWETVSLPQPMLAARVEQTAPQSIPNTAWTALVFDEEVRDDGGLFAPAAPSRMTAPIAGWYTASGGLEFVSNATGAARFAAIYKNGIPGVGRRMAAQSAPVNASGFTPRVMLAIVLYLSAGEFIEFYAYQDTGAALLVNIAADFDDTHLAMALLR